MLDDRPYVDLTRRLRLSWQCLSSAQTLAQRSEEGVSKPCQAMPVCTGTVPQQSVTDVG